MLPQTIDANLTHVRNARVERRAAYPARLERIVGLDAARRAHDEISRWPGYRPTPLHDLATLAARSGVERIWYKDESARFELKSFKALGGAYAVMQVLREAVRDELGVDATLDDLLQQRHADIAARHVISCATDGNHGRSVAWGCRLFGCGCVIYIHRDVSPGRAQAMRAFGAEVVRIDGNYDDSVRIAADEARAHGRIIVSDTSYPGYRDIPRHVMQGYTVMLAEAVAQMDGAIPTHVFVQGGVGGLAATVCGYFWALWGERRPRLLVVEPENANCLQQSARAGHPVVVEGDLETLMAGLSCGEVSELAWEILAAGADDFLTVGESAVAPTMRLLADGEPPIEAGESAVAGLGALLAARGDERRWRELGLDASSRVLVFGTEGATDPDLYRRLLESAA